jgi:hypothetical protein
MIGASKVGEVAKEGARVGIGMVGVRRSVYGRGKEPMERDLGA